MKLKNIFLLTIISLLFTMCAPRRPVVVNNPPPPPLWGPVGYETVRYYYLPDMMVYYDVHTAMFIYPRGNRWIHRTYLPGYYGHFDLYNTYKVVLHDYYGPSPYQNFNIHRNTYAVGYRGSSSQNTIGRREQDRRNYFAPSRGQSTTNRGRNSQGRNTEGRGSQGRNSQSSTTNGRQSTNSSTGRSSTTNSQNRSESSTGTRNNASNGTRTSTQNANTSPSNNRANTSQPSTRTTTSETRPQTNQEVRVNNRINPQDAAATRNRTQEIRQQQSRSSQSRGGSSSQPARSSNNRPRG